MAATYGMLGYEVQDGVATVTIDRADKLNAMAPTFWDDLRAVLAEARDDAAVRVLVVHGAGKCFSVGGDIEGFGDLTDVPSRRRYQEDALDALRAFEVFPKPTVAAVHGFALGGGCELTMVTDIVVCDETARFGTPEAGVGLMPGLGVVRGHAHAGLHWLKYLIFTGEHLDAEQAYQAGLVTRVVAQGEHLAEARRLAALIAAKPAIALQVAKRILNRGSAEGYDYSVEAVALLHGTQDQAEGVAAFREKRAPAFHDR